MSYKRTSPAPIVEGATNATTMATTDGTVYYDGTRLVTTATGTSAQVLTSNGAGVAPTYQTISAASGTIVTKFTASGTWTINAATKWVDVYVFGGGGGGGSGRQGLDTSANGGGGGAGTAAIYQRAPAQAFNAAGETVTIGAGGTGGAAQGSINSNGVSGGNITVSSLGNIATLASVGGATAALGGRTAGTTTAGQSALSIVLIFTDAGGAGGDSDPGAGFLGGGITDTPFTATGGGAGSQANSVTPQLAGDGGGSYTVAFPSGLLIAGGIGGISSGTIAGGNGNPGATANVDMFSGGTGGGGGGGQSTTGGLVAGKGGAGGIPGGGGGGGGASINGTASGAGGDGARGEIWVVEYK